MFQSLLVPLDGSQVSEQSIPTAAALAGKAGAALRLVHVHVPYELQNMKFTPEQQPQEVELGEEDERHRQEEREYLERLSQELGGVVEGGVETRVLDGPVAVAIEEFAEESHTDLIVIASHGRAGKKRLSLGSVPSALAHYPTQPLLVLHPIAGEGRVLGPLHFNHILVGLDGSKESETILDPVITLGLMGATITLLHVVSEGTMLDEQAFPLPPEEIGDVLDQADRYLESIVRRLGPGVGHVAIQAEQASSPAKGILRAADDLEVDLVAMATHGYGGIHKTVMGSVADEVLRAAPQPVLLKMPGSITVCC